MASLETVGPESQWPEKDTERLGVCPICKSPSRRLLISGLRDTLFKVAPGEWSLYSCKDCESAYLDPRPTLESIGRAYSSYYTHEDLSGPPSEQLTGLRLIQRKLANGYKNWKFGTQLRPASRLGVPAALLLPRYKAILDRQFRHLPRGTGKVLDVGFGDGGFLRNAEAMGWHAEGYDVDEKAVRNARRTGLTVHGGALSSVTGLFDVITLSHVIEHLHDPIDTLRQCFRLLAPGGTIWIETPSSKAVGLSRLKQGWLAADAPRHLVLFNRKSLADSLRSAGFVNDRDLRMASPVVGLYAMSPRILEGKNPYSKGPVPLRLRVESFFVALYESIVRSRREYLAVVANKPK